MPLSAATGSRWLRAIRTRGHAKPLPQGRPKGRGKLAPYEGFFEELVAQDPDSTLASRLRKAARDAAAQADAANDYLDDAAFQDIFT